MSIAELIDQATNLDEMAENSRVRASIYLCIGDEERSAYWRGRARGLELAAINLRASTKTEGAEREQIDT